MTQRIAYGKVAPGGSRAMSGLERYVRESGLEKSLLELVKLRASQINGCLLSRYALERCAGKRGK